MRSLPAAAPPAPGRCFPAPLPPRARRAAPPHLARSSPAKLQSALRKLVPLADRVLVKRIELQAKSAGGILLPDSGKKLNEGEVVAVGPGALGKDGKRSPISVAIGDRVLLPEYGGHTVKVGEDECVPRPRRGRRRSRLSCASAPAHAFIFFPLSPCAGSSSTATRTSSASSSKCRASLSPMACGLWAVRESE